MDLFYSLPKSPDLHREARRPRRAFRIDDLWRECLARRKHRPLMATIGASPQEPPLPSPTAASPSRSPVIGAAAAPVVQPALARIAGPILAELLLGVAVGVAGLWLASRISDATSGAFALANQVQATFFILFRVIGMGVSVVTTQNLGAGNRAAADDTARASLGISTWLGGGVGLAVLLAAPWLLTLLNAPADVQPIAAPYLRLLALGLALDAYNSTMNAVLRAHLRVRDALVNVLAMHALHLLLCLPLMRGFGPVPALGLPGFALALAASRVFGLALHLVLWRRRFDLVPTRRDWWRIDWPRLQPVLHIGIPGAAENVAYRAALMCTVAIVAGMGAKALATQAYVMQVMLLILMVGLSVGFASEILVGRLVGARRLHDAHRLVRRSLALGLCTSTGFALLAALSSGWFLRFYTRDPEIIATAQTLLWITVLLEPGRTFNMVVINALRAAGDARYPVMAGTASLIIVMAGGSWLLGHWAGLGLIGVWIAYAADEWVRGLTMAARWWRHGWVPSARGTHRALMRRRRPVPMLA